MRNFKVIWLLCSLVVFSLSGSCLAETGPAASQVMSLDVLKQISVLDLETAQRVALDNSPTLAAAVERVNQAVEQVKQAEAAYWPVVDSDASVSRVELSDNEEKARNAQLQVFSPGDSVDNPEDFYSAGVVASWIVFDGFRRHFNKLLAEYGEDASLAALIESRRLLL